MKKTTLLLIIIFLAMIATMPAHAAIKKLAQTGMQFLKVDVGARPAAMGGAFLMVGNDASAMFYNPAGISRMESGLDLFLSRTEWIAGISYNAVGVAKSIQNIGTFGITVLACDYGDDIIGTRLASTEQGFEETGKLDVGAYSFGLAYAKALTNKFSIGGQVKFAAQHLGESMVSESETVDNKVSGVAYDFGTIFYPGFKSFRFGMSIRNFSPEFKYEQEAFQLPLTFYIGFAMDVLDLMGEHENSLLIAVDATHPRDYTERVHLGGEYLFMNMIALRAGYKFNYDEESLTAGVGFQANLSGLAVRIGYAYSDMSAFDAINRLSFGLSF